MKKVDALHYLFKKHEMFPYKCTRLDFSTVIENNEARAILYLDPPYFKKGGDLYQCCFNSSDHTRLADMLKDTWHEWVLSYDDCEEIRSLYRWADIQELKQVYTITSEKNKETDKRSSRTKIELLITKKGQ